MIVKVIDVTKGVVVLRSNTGTIYKIPENDDRLPTPLYIGDVIEFDTK